MNGLSQYNLANSANMQRGMISSYELDQFYPTLDSINKLASVLDINILCCSGYSKFLLNSNTFKKKLFEWRLNNNLTIKDASKLLSVSERSYSSWESGVIIRPFTYNKVKINLIKYNLID